MTVHIILSVWLILLSVCDIRKRSVPVSLLAAGMIAAILLRGYLCLLKEMPVASVYMDSVPGLFFLMIAFITKKAGYGDGAVLLILGLFMGLRQCSYVLMLALLLGAAVSVILLLLRKVTGKTELPFLPFLGFGYVVCMIVGN